MFIDKAIDLLLAHSVVHELGDDAVVENQSVAPVPVLPDESLLELPAWPEDASH